MVWGHSLLGRPSIFENSLNSWSGRSHMQLDPVTRDGKKYKLPKWHFDVLSLKISSQRCCYERMHHSFMPVASVMLLECSLICHSLFWLMLLPGRMGGWGWVGEFVRNLWQTLAGSKSNTASEVSFCQAYSDNHHFNACHKFYTASPSLPSVEVTSFKSNPTCTAGGTGDDATRMTTSWIRHLVQFLTCALEITCSLITDSEQLLWNGCCTSTCATTHIVYCGVSRVPQWRWKWKLKLS